MPYGECAFSTRKTSLFSAIASQVWCWVVAPSRAFLMNSRDDPHTTVEQTTNQRYGNNGMHAWRHAYTRSDKMHDVYNERSTNRRLRAAFNLR